MRLINTTTLQLQEFVDDDIPSYAILSHRWGKDEVTIKDMEGGDAQSKGEAYDKIVMTCSVAAAAGLEYAWMDTCCIDKTSSAELSEAINSMYHWYQDAVVCYAFLSDVRQDADQIADQIASDDIDPGDSAFENSKWFTRGWTLQELIAPSTVIFLNGLWEEIGTKISLQPLLTRITGIPGPILRGVVDVGSASVAQRMSWAASRVTTRTEDQAYCLMGLFGINMPMLYGEGERAFIRLQEEILRVSKDHTIFAWNYSYRDLTESAVTGSFLAVSPASFQLHSGEDIMPTDPNDIQSEPISVDSEGIHLVLHVYEPQWSPDWNSYVRQAVLPCRYGDQWIALTLAIRGGPDKRVGRMAFLDPRKTDLRAAQYRKLCVAHERRARKRLSALSRIAASGDINGVRLTLEKGTDSSVREAMAGQAVIAAAVAGQAATVDLLLCDKSITRERRQAASKFSLSAAWRRGASGAVAVLVQKGLADYSEKDLSDLLARQILQPINWQVEQTEMVAIAELIFQSLQPFTARAVVEQVFRKLDYRSSEHFTLVMLLRRLLEDALGR